MKTREYLNQSYKLEKRINSKLDQISTLRAMAENISSTISDVPPSGTRNVSRTQDIIIKIIGLENEINDDIDSLIEVKHEIMHAIKGVDNIDCQLLLEMRYLSYHTWEQIAVDLGYCMDNVFKLHRRALDMISFPE
ncbi:hypothetical protein EAL2_808p01600 (plasmid) [Peptoclostridium acidaminophilum DSM 3953]|uniref:DUF1492 domain-containing protein n=1 Tax=Peptoclostridium acidaminophilum DSM 3953 TaxID=1286171 RepID=W8T9V0_PEPAC|nr:DUF1492 domain-containing protein [Peptoclostridium acidaminophilum]AHM57665.1 hypothetical protein EAL2_808p01600 [Peptoclostridium acidaminophilum DSM 3953]